MTASRTRILVEIGLTVALAAVLNFLKLWRMPLGGDVSLEMLPIVVLALRRGWKSGVAAGILYGVVSLMLGATVVHPVQLLMDYPLAYALVGVAGVYAGMVRSTGGAGWRSAAWIVAAVATGSAARFVVHFVSGLVFFASYTPAGQSTWAYSAAYNGTYMLPAAALCAVAAAAIIPALERALPVEASR